MITEYKRAVFECNCPFHTGRIITENFEWDKWVKICLNCGVFYVGTFGELTRKAFKKGIKVAYKLWKEWHNKKEI